MPTIAETKLLQDAIRGLGDSFYKNRVLEQQKARDTSSADYRTKQLQQTGDYYDSIVSGRETTETNRLREKQQEFMQKQAQLLMDGIRDGIVDPKTIKGSFENMPPEQLEAWKQTPLWNTIQAGGLQAPPERPAYGRSGTGGVREYMDEVDKIKLNNLQSERELLQKEMLSLQDSSGAYKIGGSERNEARGSKAKMIQNRIDAIQKDMEAITGRYGGAQGSASTQPDFIYDPVTKTLKKVN